MTALPASSVAQLTGLSLRQLRYLAQQNLVLPTVRPASGRGSEALYAPADLLALLVIERVRAVCGQEVRSERLRTILDALSSRPPGAGSQQLVMDAGGCWVQNTPIDAVLRRSTAALVLDLDAISDELGLRLRRAGVRADPALAA